MGGEEQDRILALIHDMQMLASDWLTALSVTVIPINLTENGRETERGRSRE